MVDEGVGEADAHRRRGRVVHGGQPQDEPLAVPVHDQRRRSARAAVAHRGPLYAAVALKQVMDPQRPARPIDGLLAGTRDVGGRRHQRDARLVLRARHIERQGMRGGHAGALIEQRLDLRIHRHGVFRGGWSYCAALACDAAVAGRNRSSTCPGPLSRCV